MNTNRRHAVAALIAAGLLWGTTVPLSKLALEWLSPGWLTAVRFGLAAAVLLAAARRRGLRRAFTPAVLAAGALGYGGSVLLQNAGISRTSVTHAALLIGAVPVLVAIIAAAWHRTVARPVAWSGFVLSLGGVGLVTAGSGGGGTTPAGDGLVLASLVLSATVTVAQGRLLTGRDPVAVTAVQFLGAALGALPVAALTGGTPAAPGGAGPVLAVAALVAGGTLLPFTLFAFGQSRVSAEVAGAFLNLEPLVGALAGAVAFGDPVGFTQAGGGVAIVAGIGLSSLPLLSSRRTAPRQTAPPATNHARYDQAAQPSRPPRNPPRCRVAPRGFHHNLPGWVTAGRTGRAGRPLLRRRGYHRGRRPPERGGAGVHRGVRTGQGGIGQLAPRGLPGRRAAATDPASQGRLPVPEQGQIPRIVRRRPAGWTGRVHGRLPGPVGCRRAGRRGDRTRLADQPPVAARVGGHTDRAGRGPCRDAVDTTPRRLVPGVDLAVPPLGHARSAIPCSRRCWSPWPRGYRDSV
jgi:drug/metabolite transporter (DMT)-like permease